MLRDHFHPPLKGRRHWEAFHSGWATNLAAELNRILPPHWFAEPSVHYGIQVAPDVATWEAADDSGESVSAAFPSWTPEAPTMTLDIALTTDIVQVDVFNGEAGPVLAGAIELVSPSNKDRRESRDAFVSKCESFLREAIGLVVIDIVTDRHANLHNELLNRLGETSASSRGLYACAYHPTSRDEHTVLDLWHHPLSIGGTLPTLPLSLKNGPRVPIDLAKSYAQTCEQLRLNDASFLPANS
ncbi:DUF4058 family protein [Armatimonas sp.]|uniref:DUF4058 family protein n=1 Tax=Armatimonas sp. TaxID=1872638 RepID=UPI00374D90F4